MRVAALVNVGGVAATAPPPREAGRLRSASRLLVATGPGQTTVTPTAGARASSSTRSVSLTPTTAYLLATYGALPPPMTGARPAIDATLTTCPVPRATSAGTNARSTLATPY